MRVLSGGLTCVNVATVGAVLLGMAAGGLRGWIALVCLLLGIAAGVIAATQTFDSQIAKGAQTAFTIADSGRRNYRRVWFWLVAACFGFFAFRSFCWLLFSDGNQLKVQSPNNLGDLSLHIAYIKNFANGVPLWPENPIHAFSKVRYPAGTDIFNALLLLVGLDLTRGLVWTGLVASLATFYALYRWGGVFTVAGFLFNGGLTGFAVFESLKLLDYQDKGVAWKSLPLSMLVTQRGLLYALPAGLLLLYHWRAKYLAVRPRGDVVVAGGDDPGSPEITESSSGRPQRRRLQDRAGLRAQRTKLPLPFWVEVALYATMPLFHLHTFIALSIVAAFFFLIGDSVTRKHFAMIVALALLPATFFVWSITDHFQARSLIEWHPGWVQTTGDLANPFFKFWVSNFGIFLPLVLALIAVCIWQALRSNEWFKSQPALVFITPAVMIFLLACLVKTAPWEWDNIKLIIWAYLIVLPFLWSELIARWETPFRVAVCVALFTSGFVSLFGSLAENRTGHGIADRAELDAVGFVTRKLPVEARFAAFPTYNHPLLLQGRKVVLGYPGHLWTQGFDYGAIEKKLTTLMEGATDWREQARELRVRYLFWGREEKAHYATSMRPWEHEAQLIATGKWGAIYDLGAPGG